MVGEGHLLSKPTCCAAPPKGILKRLQDNKTPLRNKLLVPPAGLDTEVQQSSSAPDEPPDWSETHCNNVQVWTLQPHFTK